MEIKKFFITRVEKSTVLKRVEYEIEALSKTDALKKLNKLEYKSRDTRDEVQEDNWLPQEIIEIIEERN